MKWTHKSLLGITVEKETGFRHPTVEGLWLRAFRSGQKSWQWKRTLNGKALRKSLGRFPAITLVEAQAIAAELNEQVGRGVDPTEIVAPAPVQVRVTVAEAWERYIADCRRRGNREGATFKRDLAGRKDIVDRLGGKLLSEVSTDDLRAAISAPLHRAKGCSRAITGGAIRSNHTLSIARTFFKFCLDNGYDDLARNPATPIKPIKAINGSKPKRVLSLREMALLVMAAREFDRRRGGKTTWGDIVSLLVLNGNRKSEVLEAMGDEWDSETGLWRIDAQRYKTGVNCVLPVGPTSAAIFAQRAKQGRFLFPAQSGVRTGQDRHICDALTKIMEEIGGDPVKRWSMHCIRYGFRSNIRKEKIADSELAERIIHPGAGGDMSVHYDPDWLDEMRDALANWDARIASEIVMIGAEKIKLAA